MSDGESVHSRAILSKAATGGRRGLKMNKRKQTNIYFQVLIRTSSGISISRKSALKLVNLPRLKIIRHLKEQRYTFAKSWNFADVCTVGDTNFPSTIQMSSRSFLFVSFQHITLKHGNFTIFSGVAGFSPTGPSQNLRKPWNGVMDRFSQGQKRSFRGNF